MAPGGSILLLSFSYWGEFFLTSRGRVSSRHRRSFDYYVINYLEFIYETVIACSIVMVLCPFFCFSTIVYLVGRDSPLGWSDSVGTIYCIYTGFSWTQRITGT